MNHPYLLCTIDHSYLLYTIKRPSILCTIDHSYLLLCSINPIWLILWFWDIFIKKILGYTWVDRLSPKTIQHIFKGWTITTYIFKSFWHSEFELCDKRSLTRLTLKRFATLSRNYTNIHWAFSIKLKQLCIWNVLELIMGSYNYPNLKTDDF